MIWSHRSVWFGVASRQRWKLTLGIRSRARWRFVAWVMLAGLPWLLSACYSPLPPTPELTPTCYPRPEPTGEKIIGATVEAPPPTQVSPAQAITLTLSGSYIIANNAIVCGASSVVRHVYSDELPGFSWDRSVDVMLDAVTLASFNCGYACRVEVTIPADTAPGPHQLILRTGLERVNFDIFVTSPQP